MGGVPIVLRRVSPISAMLATSLVWRGVLWASTTSDVTTSVPLITCTPVDGSAVRKTLALTAACLAAAFLCDLKDLKDLLQVPLRVVT